MAIATDTVSKCPICGQIPLLRLKSDGPPFMLFHKCTKDSVSVNITGNSLTEVNDKWNREIMRYCADQKVTALQNNIMTKKQTISTDNLLHPKNWVSDEPTPVSFDPKLLDEMVEHFRAWHGLRGKYPENKELLDLATELSTFYQDQIKSTGGIEKLKMFCEIIADYMDHK